MLEIRIAKCAGWALLPPPVACRATVLLNVTTGTRFCARGITLSCTSSGGSKRARRRTTRVMLPRHILDRDICCFYTSRPIAYKCGCVWIIKVMFPYNFLFYSTNRHFYCYHSHNRFHHSRIRIALLHIRRLYALSE